MRRLLVVLVAAAACGRSGPPDTSKDVTVGTVTVGISVVGPGSVQGGGQATGCSSACNFQVPTGTTVHLTAAAAPNAIFSGWSGPCSGLSDCDVVAQADLTVGATFAPATATLHKLQVAVLGSGSVRSGPAGIECVQSCAAAFVDGTQVTLTAAAAPGWTFTGFSGACSGTECSMVVAADAQVTATFVQSAATLSVQQTGSGNVISAPAGIDCPRVCSAAFASEALVTLTATPLPGFSFAGFSGACSGATCTLRLSSDAQVSAAFTAIPTHRLSVAMSGTGVGRVTSTPAGIDCPGVCSAAFQDGISVSLAATPDALSRFTLWAGACTASPCAVKIQADNAAVAQFDNRRYVVMDLGAPPGGWWSVGQGISPGGRFVSGNGGGNDQIFFWDGAMRDIGVAHGSAGGVNDSGAMAGSYQFGGEGGLWHAFRWQSGALTDLGTLGGTTSNGASINRDGVVAGWASRADGVLRAAFWSSGSAVDLGSLGGGFSACSFAYGINAGGIIVGESCVDSGGTHAVRYRSPGVIDDLGTLGGTFGTARGINDAGVIVGFASDATGVYRGFVFDNGRMIDAGALPGLPYTELVAINSTGIAVGGALNFNGVQRGVIYGGGRMLDLNMVIDGSPYVITFAPGIDAAGDIVAQGNDNGVLRALILRPH